MPTNGEDVCWSSRRYPSKDRQERGPRKDKRKAQRQARKTARRRVDAAGASLEQRVHEGPANTAVRPSDECDGILDLHEVSFS